MIEDRVQLSLTLPDKVFRRLVNEAEKLGYVSVQELIRQKLREKETPVKGPSA